MDQISLVQKKKKMCQMPAITFLTKDKDAYADITEAVEAEYDWTDTYFLLKVQD